MTTVVETHARRSDPDTSHTAAKRTDIIAIKAKAYLVIDAAGAKGIIGEELNRDFAARFPGLAKFDTPRKRISDLVNDGMVFATEGRRAGQRVFVSLPIARLMGLTK